MVLKFDAFEDDGEEGLFLFDTSRNQGVGMNPRKEERDVNTRMQSNLTAASSSNQVDIPSTYTDLTGITKTITLESEAKAMIIFSGRFTFEADSHASGVAVKIVVNSSDVANSERKLVMDYYAETDPTVNVLSDDAFVTIGTNAVVTLPEGSNTIKIQAKYTTTDGEDLTVIANEREMDILILSDQGKLSD